MTTEEEKSAAVFRHISRYVGILLGSVAVAGIEIGRACQSGVKIAGKLFVSSKDEHEEAPQAAEAPCDEPAEAVEAAAPVDVETPEPEPEAKKPEAKKPDAKKTGAKKTGAKKTEAEAEKTEESGEDVEKEAVPSS